MTYYGTPDSESSNRAHYVQQQWTQSQT